MTVLVSGLLWFAMFAIRCWFKATPAGEVSLGQPSVGGSYAGSTRHQAAAVLVLSGSGRGLTTSYAAALLAAHGYPSLALAYFTVCLACPRPCTTFPWGTSPRRWGAAGPARRGSPACPGQWGVAGRRGRAAARRLLPAAVNGVVAGVPSSVANPTPLPQGGPAWTVRGQPAGLCQRPFLELVLRPEIVI